MDGHNSGFIVFGKESDLQSRSRGETWENLPFGFYAGPGPTAWRNIEGPEERYVAAGLRAKAEKRLRKERRKGRLARLLTRDKTEEAMRDLYLARQMEER